MFKDNETIVSDLQLTQEMESIFESGLSYPASVESERAQLKQGAKPGAAQQASQKFHYFTDPDFSSEQNRETGAFIIRSRVDLSNKCCDVCNSELNQSGNVNQVPAERSIKPSHQVSFDMNVPDQLTIVIVPFITFNVTADQADENEAKIEMLVNALCSYATGPLGKARLTQMGLKKIDVVTTSGVRWIQPQTQGESREQQLWRLNGTYLQVAFLDWNTPVTEAPEALEKMCFADKLYAELGVVDPGEVERYLASHENRAVSSDSPFNLQPALWCADLIDLRNELLVALRAGLRGSNPTDAVNEFKTKKYAHFLDATKTGRKNR